MSQLKSDFLKISQERGFIHQCTDLTALDNLMSKKSCHAYLGFDATAPSLHVGSLVGIMWLRLLQKTGHTPMVLIGGTTSKIGDPSGKDTARQLLDEESIKNNVQSIRQVFSQFLKNDGPNAVIHLNNEDWLEQLGYVEFLRNFGRYFSVNRMLSFDSVKLRLEREQNLSFLEFNYMIFQGYDFLHLSRSYNCALQLGGSDQWGNIVNGVELCRRIDNKDVFGLTTALITTANGQKMGKSASGAVWLSSNMLSPYDYWQFWRNTDDRDVVRYLKLYTELPIEEIDRLAKLQDSEINEAKKILANEATAILHGANSLSSIHETIAKLFEQNTGGSLDSLPKIVIKKDDIPISIDELLVKSGLVASKGEAKRLIAGGGARLNDHPIEDFKLIVEEKDFNSDNLLKLSSGKKKHVVIQLHS